MNPTARQVHIDQALTNLSIAYVQRSNGYIHTAFPTVGVKKKSDRYFIFNKSDFYRDEAQRRAPGTVAAEGGYRLSDDQYECIAWAYRHKMPEEVRANFDAPLDADKAGVSLVSQKLLIRRDREFAVRYLVPGVWANQIVGIPAGAPAAGQFLRWDRAGSTPIANVRSALRTVQRESGGFRPNVLILGSTVYDALVDHPEILARIANTQRGIVTRDLLASIWDLEEVLVAEAVYDMAPLGAPAPVMSFVVGDVALLAYRTHSPAIDQPSAGYVFSWSKFDRVRRAGAAGIRRYYQEDIKSEWYEGEAHFDMKVTATDCGFFFDQVVN